MKIIMQNIKITLAIQLIILFILICIRNNAQTLHRYTIKIYLNKSLLTFPTF
jgi:hypothetical protein